MTRKREQPLRVLLVTHYYPPHVGGIENVVRQEARHLAQAGAEVTVLTSAVPADAAPAGAASDAGVRVVRLRVWNGAERRAGVPFPLFGPSLPAAALRWVRWADVVHIHDCLYMTSWAAGLAAVLTRTPHILTQHVAVVDHPSTPVRAVQHAVYRFAGRRLLRRARSVVVLNATVGRFVEQHGARPDRVRHLPNGVDTGLFHASGSAAERDRVRARFGLPVDRLLVLFVGRLVPKKGCGLLLAAADPAYDLVFAGEGNEVPEQPGPGVHRLGALGPADLAELYRACDVFALPSTTEGFPLTVQEAMASGLPVVTTDDPGYAPYGLDRTRVALLPRDAELIRKTLTELAGDSELRAAMGAYAHAYARDGFAWEEHASALLGLYDAAVAGRR